MTKEEAKALGATHTNKYGRYFKSDSVGYLYFLFDDEWKPMYMTIHESNAFNSLKPL